jgi:hypothetical protein
MNPMASEIGVPVKKNTRIMGSREGTLKKK